MLYGEGKVSKWILRNFVVFFQVVVLKILIIFWEKVKREVQSLVRLSKLLHWSSPAPFSQVHITTFHKLFRL